MVIKSDKAYKSLTKKGFLDAPGDHTFLEFYHEDNRKVSIGWRTLED